MAGDAVLEVVIVPALVMVVKAPDKVFAPKLKVPPAVVVSTPFTTKFPLALWLLLVLLTLRLLYVPATTVCPPVAKA